MVNLKGVPLGLAELILKKFSATWNSKGLEFSFFKHTCFPDQTVTVTLPFLFPTLSGRLPDSR